MKFLALPFLLAATCFLSTGCETVETIPEEAASDFERGVTGRGQIVPIDQSNDPFIKE